MGTWLKRLWTDEDAFWAVSRTIVRFGVAFVGAAITAGWIPTGVEGGNNFGPFLALIGIGIPSRSAPPKA